MIIGGGAIGMLAALLLGHYGVGDVTVAEVNPLRRKTVELHAACKTYNPVEERVAESA